MGKTNSYGLTDSDIHPGQVLWLEGAVECRVNHADPVGRRVEITIPGARPAGPRVVSFDALSPHQLEDADDS